MGSSSADQVVQTVTSQWYNALVDQLNLSPDQFQLAQGNVSLPGTSPELWNFLDSIPPYSVTQYWTGFGRNSFSGQYGLLVSRLQDNFGDAFKVDMGDYYPSWVAYAASNDPKSYDAKGFVDRLGGWAYGNMPPEQASKCISDFRTSLDGTIGQANTLWGATGGPGGIKAYQGTVDDVKNKIGRALWGSVTINSNTTSSDLSRTWARGSIEGHHAGFFGKIGAEYSSATSQLNDAGFSVTANFTNVLILPVQPLSQGTVLAGTATYNPWYVPQALASGYNNNNYRVWYSGNPGWNSFFAPGGSLPRAVTSLVVVDGIEAILTSNSAIASSDQQAVGASFSAGFFPFFAANGQGGWSTDHGFNAEGRITATSKCPVGSPQILGILQSPISALVGAAG
ncbi:hypothetical protein [Frankia sp. QA3]|uniref:hypothetical protein n=1 Tax=Frankia sp. QA3 TaxID=710111 RepID=UPI000269C0DB|nr:hypothetical protein [Frankia sp. QA3]EIV92032.1 hypothetical protein FraQA3DRAFT_1526 [Frankia sp. QA3]